MSLQFILLLVIGVVVVLDFVLNARKKSDSGKSVKKLLNKESEKSNTIKLKNKKIINYSLIFLTMISLFFTIGGIRPPGDSDFDVLFRTITDIFPDYFSFNKVYWDGQQVVYGVYNLVYIFSPILLLSALGLIYLNVKKSYFNFLQYFIKRPKNTTLFIIVVLFVKSFIDSMFNEVTMTEAIELIFKYDLVLFIPSIFIVGFFAWYFNDKIKAR